MEFDDDKVIEVLQKLPSEGPFIDYKITPYKKNQNHEFLRDVIAMLNSEVAIGKDKFIIVGVTDSTKELIGIEQQQWRDDSEWQDLLKKISPRPDVRTGIVKYMEKLYGYFYIPGTNNEWVYEAKESVISSPDDRVKEKNILARGQAYTRIGSTKEVLTDEGRRRLLENKIQRSPSQSIVVTDSAENKAVLIALAMVGTWNEQFEGDNEVIERLSGTTIEENKIILRSVHDKNPDFLQFSGNCWKLNDHKAALINVAKNIFDDHVDLFFEVLALCLKETDPKFELPSNKRSLASILKNINKRKYSSAMVSGLSETMAILGNKQSQFANCSRFKVINCIYNFEREFFKTKDWKVYATCSRDLPMFGEACPDVFMDEICRLLRDKDEAFVHYLSEEESYISVAQYGYEVASVLSNIAKLENYFSKAMETLLLLSEIRSLFLDSMVSIVLPWYPQTHASPAVRVGVFKGLYQENRKLTWAVLMKLMPNATTSSSTLQKPKYLEVEDLPEQVTTKEYNETTVAYIRLAESLLDSDIERLCSMVSILDDVDYSLQQEILDSIKKSSEALNDNNKAILWNELKDFTHKHRKYADADWAIDEERLGSVDELAEWLVPNDENLLSIRLFRNDQYSLFLTSGHFEEEEERLKREQTEILKSKYDKEGIEGVLQFVETIENKKVAGSRAREILNEKDVYFSIMNSKGIESDPFLEGLITSHQFIEIESIIEDCSDEVKAKVLEKLPLTDDLISYVETLEVDTQEIFWKGTSAWGTKSDSFTLLEKTVSKLNEYKRTEKSIALLYLHVIHDSCDVSTETVIATLSINVDNQGTQNEYYVQQLIKWLQERNTDRAKLLIIEWQYLAFLRKSEGYPPVTLWQELSSNPEFFVHIIKIICGKEKDDSWDDNDKQNISRHCFDLIYGWKILPGLDSTGNVDKNKLDNWYKHVKEASEEYGITSMAMSYFGRTTFYAPADPDGFFVHREVAKFLQADLEGSILSGYHAEAIDSRGVHIVDPTGQTEFKIEEDYISKAREADENGLFRLAETLRDIAASYHEEGLRNQENH